MCSPLVGDGKQDQGAAASVLPGCSCTMQHFTRYLYGKGRQWAPAPALPLSRCNTAGSGATKAPTGINLLISIAKCKRGLFLQLITSSQVLRRADLFIPLLYHSEGSLQLQVMPSSLRQQLYRNVRTRNNLGLGQRAKDLAAVRKPNGKNKFHCSN